MGGGFLSRLSEPPPFYSYDEVPMHPGIDSEARGMIIIADRMAPVMTPALCREVEHNIRDRIRWVAESPMAPAWFQQQLRSLDPFLRARVRLDIQRWVIERWSVIDQCWVQVLLWEAQNGDYLPIDGYSSLILHILRESDMQRYSSPSEYLAMRREQARKIREANEKAQSEKMAAVIDGMSDRQIDEFVAVENALATGDKIISHGEQEKQLERMHERSKQLGDLPDSSINPGDRPDRRLSGSLRPKTKES